MSAKKKTVKAKFYVANPDDNWVHAEEFSTEAEARDYVQTQFDDGDFGTIEDIVVVKVVAQASQPKLVWK
jgi:hypothetical protein